MVPMALGWATVPAQHWGAPFWRSHSRTRAVVVTLVGLAYGLVLGLNVVSLLTGPRLSLVLAVPSAGPAHITWVLPGGLLWERGVRQGDRVLALNRHPPTQRDAGSWTGYRMLVRMHAGGVVAIEADAMRQGHDTWPLLVLSPCFLLFGTLVMLRASQPLVGRAAYSLFASAAFAFAVAPATDNNEVGGTIAELILLSLVAACFVGFFLAFPVGRGTTRLHTLLLLPPLGAIVLGLIALVWPALYDAVRVLRGTILLVYLLLGCGLLVYSFVVTRERDTRRALTVITIGTVTSVLPFAMLSLLPTALGRHALVAAEHTVLALALLPASFAYAILRHNILNVHLLQRWLVQGVAWAGLLALFVAVVSARHAFPGTALPEPGRGIALAAVLVLLAGGAFWLRDRLQRLLDRLIFKDAYDYRASLQQLSRDLSLAGDRETLGTSLPGTLRRLMNLEFAMLLGYDRGGPCAYGVCGAYQSAMLSALAMAAQEVQHTPQVVPLEDGVLPVLLIPLRTHDAVVGHLCLGPKASGEPFRAEDRDLLATLSGHLAAIVRNIELVDDLRAKVSALDALNERLQRAHEEERARLVADIHDEALQTACRLQRLLAAGRSRAVTAQHLALSRTLINQLHALCAAVRPAALDELGLAAAIEVLALERGAQADVLIRLDDDAELAGVQLPAGADIVLYRAAQEALNNSLRHAHPRTVDISLRHKGDMVQLRVADDGAGFAVAAHVDDLAAAGHLGLAGLHYRVQRAGGRMAVTSTPGAGTVMQVELPLEGVIP